MTLAGKYLDLSLAENLSPRAFSLIPYIIHHLQPDGTFVLSYATAAEFLDISKSTAKFVIAELVKSGILTCCEHSQSRFGTVYQIGLFSDKADIVLHSENTSEAQQKHTENTVKTPQITPQKHGKFEGILYITNNKLFEYIHTTNQKINYDINTPNTPELTLENQTQEQPKPPKRKRSVTQSSAKIDLLGTEPTSPHDPLPAELIKLFESQGKQVLFPDYPNIYVSEAEYNLDLNGKIPDKCQVWLAEVLQERSNSLNEYKGVPNWKHFRRSRSHSQDMVKFYKAMLRRKYTWNDAGNKWELNS
jgi:hypothetical protein